MGCPSNCASHRLYPTESGLGFVARAIAFYLVEADGRLLASRQRLILQSLAISRRAEGVLTSLPLRRISRH